MKLPYREKAIIPKEKLTSYLLSLTHPVGKSKAMFFRKNGFDETTIIDLEQALFTVAQGNDVKKIVEVIYGKNYAVDGMITTPSGRMIIVRTVWFIKTKTSKPSFVTAYPV